MHAGRNYYDALGQGALDLAPHEVVGVVQPAPPLGVRCSQPAAADERDENVARCNGLADRLAELRSQGNGVDVHEDPLVAIPRGEQVIEPTRVPTGIVAAVAQENPKRTVMGRHDGGVVSHEAARRLAIGVTGRRMVRGDRDK